MLYLGVSDTHDAQLKIIEALTRKFKLDPALRLETIAARCPFNYTGADFYALCSDAMLKAMTRKAEEIDFAIGAPAFAPVMLCRASHYRSLADVATFCSMWQPNLTPALRRLSSRRTRTR